MANFEVVALLRVPGGYPVLYAGDLVLMTRYQEGWSVVTRRLGEPVIDKEPLAVATARIEAKYGPLPAPLAAAYWCAGQGVPVLLTPDSFAASRELLERAVALPRP